MITDREWIALTLYGEARGLSTAARLAVADVLRNRLHTGRWGTTYDAVCRAPKQFSCWNGTDPNLVTLKALIVRIESGQPFREPVLAECEWIADGVLREVLRPQFASKPTHYYAASMNQPPAWAKTGAFAGNVGGHLFFSGVK